MSDLTIRRDVVIWPPWTPWPVSPCCPTVEESYDIVTALFSMFSASQAAPIDVNFLNQSTNAVNYLWDFGDLTTSTSTNPTHSFDTGSFVILLQATGSGPATNVATYSLGLTASAPTITADFTASLTESSVSSGVDFINLTTYNGSGTPTYLWALGDNSSSVATTPPHQTYSNDGIYEVSLQATGSYNIADKKTRPGYLNILPDLPPGYIAWWRSNTGYWTDDGITPAGMGDQVYRWDDQSGNGYHMYQTSATLRPRLRTATGSIFTGSTCLQFDGTNDYMYAQNVPFGALTGMSMFVVVRFTGLTAFSTFMAVGFQRHELRLNPATIGYNHFNVGVTSVGTGTGANYTVGGIYDDSNNTIELWMNGTSSAGPAVDANAFEGTMDVVLGCRTDGTLPTSGYIAEAIIYPSTLNSTTTQNVFKYLNRRFFG